MGRVGAARAGSAERDRKISRAALISENHPLPPAVRPPYRYFLRMCLRAILSRRKCRKPLRPLMGQLSGLTALSFAAGALPAIYDQQVSVNMMLGSFGSEVGLLADAAERTGSLTIGGSDNLPAQAVLAASVTRAVDG